MPINADDFFKSNPIKIESTKYGSMEFSELVLKDFSWLEDKKTHNLPAREFIVQLMYLHLLIPKLEEQEINNWSDNELSRVAIEWFRNQQEDDTLPNASSFEVIKDSIYGYYDSVTGETRKQIDGVLKPYAQFINSLPKITFPLSQFALPIPTLGNAFSQLANNIILPQVPSLQSTFAGIQNMNSVGKAVIELGSVFQQVFASTQMISNISNSIAASLPRFDISPTILNTAQFFAGLPDLAQLGEILKEAKEGSEAFNKAGFSFITSDYVSISTARHFASVNPKIRSAVITNELAAETRRTEFEQKLQQIFQESSVLRRRWPIIAQAIKAHRRREYNISIPALLAQVEGIVGDALILNGLVASQGHKLYMKEANGKLKRDKKGKLIEARGVGSLIQRSTWQTQPVLQEVADLITTQIAGERNHILHGRKTTYGTAKLSVQGLLLLFVISAEVFVFETGQTP